MDEPRVEHGFDFVTGENPLDDLLGFFPVWILDPLAVSAHIGTGVMGTDPVGGIKAREGEELGWGVPRFFQEFAPGGSVGLFAVLKPARRKLPMGFAVRVPILADEEHPPVRQNGDDCDRGPDFNDVVFLEIARGQGDHVAPEGAPRGVVDALG